MNPIPTEFKGVKFRSRMEARWAVFMDSLGVRYDYEPEAFNLGGLCYLPDFFVPSLDCYLEVKPFSPVGDEREKCDRLVVATGKDLRVLIGNPTQPLDGITNEAQGIESLMFIGEESAALDEPYFWCQCSKCGRVGIEYQARVERVGCGHFGDEHTDGRDTLALRRAYQTAASHRFWDPK